MAVNMIERPSIPGILMYLPSVFKERLLHRLFQFMIITTYCEKRYMLEGQTCINSFTGRSVTVKRAFSIPNRPWSMENALVFSCSRAEAAAPPSDPGRPLSAEGGKHITSAVSQHKTAGPRNSPRLRRFLLRTSLKYMRDNKRSTLSYKAGLPALLMTVSFRLHRNSKSQNFPMAVSFKTSR